MAAPGRPPAVLATRWQIVAKAPQVSLGQRLGLTVAEAGHAAGERRRDTSGPVGVVVLTILSLPL
jgi:hypothetical protein